VFDRTASLGRRDEVVLRLLLDTGVRVPELCGLELTDVDLDRELAYVTGKGSRPRVVPFGAKTAQALDRHLRVQALHPQARSPRLLLGQRGPMTRKLVASIHVIPPRYRVSTSRSAASTRRISSKLRRPALAPRRCGSTAAVCSARTVVTCPPISTSGRKVAARADDDVGATNQVDNGSR
jgi:integrase